MNVEEISQQEMQDLNGGSFWYDFSYAVGVTVRAVKDISASLSKNPNYGNASVYK